MSWKSKLSAFVRGKSFLSNQVDSLIQRIVDRVEPELWGLMYERIPTSSYNEARGYVWARSALAIDRTTNELAGELQLAVRVRVAAEARAILADRVVEQLKMYDGPKRVRRAA